MQILVYSIIRYLLFGIYPSIFLSLIFFSPSERLWQEFPLPK